jgi:DNA-binding NtrC family response regulator
MGSKQHGDWAPVLYLVFERSIERMVAEVLTMEGFQVQHVYTNTDARTLLDSSDDEQIVLIDNLQGHDEGQQFLHELRQQPGLRLRLKVVCMAAWVNCEWARQEYGDVLDAYLAMPFTVSQLLDTLTSL